ncbi:HTH domain-containing protein [Staphylococcus cohnii species complex 1663]|uniref:HTH domain-containing protein n=1 Tax=Staphylococcus cohnii species complex 1663 TaxID=3239421 RepID=UPI0034D671FE
MNRLHRLLSIYTRFLKRKELDKLELSTEFKVSERTIIRDIQEIRNYFYDNDEWVEKEKLFSITIIISTQLRITKVIFQNWIFINL